MERLLPPVLEPTIALQTGTELKIPFQYNKAVQENEVEKIVLRIKTVSTTNWVGNLISSRVDKGFAYFCLDTSAEKISITKQVLGVPEETSEQDVKNLVKKFTKVGQYYKVQLACVSIGTSVNLADRLGYFSTVGIYKYSTSPSLSIDGGEKNNYEYVGIYSQQNQDLTEKIYNYCFDLFELVQGEEKFISSSGTQIHNSSEDDNSGITKDFWHFKVMLEDSSEHTLLLKYKVTSLNGFQGYCEKQMNQKNNGIQPTEIKFTASNIYDEGYVNIYIENQSTKARKFYLYRQREDENLLYQISDIIELNSKQYFNFNDFSNEQGYEYNYYLQEILPDLTYSKNLSVKVKSDFEDMFLYDGVKQLKIKFNPQVSSFKTVLSETKTMTIGSQYPYITSNGNINYKEFGISGLLSYLQDEQQLFVKSREEKFKEFSTNLSSANIQKERIFKLLVLDWLNDGKIKIFKSPTEGNYLVRLMNINLNPNEVVGRMLHTFNCQASEVETYNVENLQKLNMYKGEVGNVV